jgi:16S rRNA (guanine(966)-N(2))-methyltransferase RsmD
VREALFMSLEPLAGLNVVDLFAGSGALGIEALSRGAARADFVERERNALATLKSNLERLELTDRTTVWAMDLRFGIKPIRAVLGSADLVLLDPPYGQGQAEEVLAALGSGVLATGARVVVEHHSKELMPERSGGLMASRRRKYGETAITLYVCEADS